MSAPFKVGDWVTWGESAGVAYEVFGVNDYRLVVRNGGIIPLNTPGLRTMIVKEAKPPRKLTLSAGLAWMHDFNNRNRTHLALTSASDIEWIVKQVIDITETRGETYRGATPLKAIIAARKVLVKS